MSIFDKLTSALTTQDLADLLEAGAVETVRLEYKRAAPPKDEALKKLTSFANTYGGIMIIGAEAGNDGKLTALPGVDPAPGIKQQLIQWCYDGVYPPLQPYISDAIPTPTNPAKACYVVYVEESEEAPHFLDGRRGVYVRSDEFSQLFRPELATYEELQHLANRRQVLVERKMAQSVKAQTRFETHARIHYRNTPGAVGDIGATSLLQIIPVYPARQLVS
jgi:predicted HTH transcriptional regulator